MRDHQVLVTNPQSEKGKLYNAEGNVLIVSLNLG